MSDVQESLFSGINKTFKSDLNLIEAIRNNPNNLLMNSGFFYKFYQNKESKKVSLKSALESLYEELEETKLVYNSII